MVVEQVGLFDSYSLRVNVGIMMVAVGGAMEVSKEFIVRKLVE